MAIQFNPALGETVKVRRTIGGKSVLTKGTVVAFKSGGYSVRQKAFLQSVGIQFRKGGGIVYFAKSSVLPETKRGMRVANPGRKAKARRVANPAKRRDALDTFTQSYIETALWSSTGDDERPLDDKYTPSDLTVATLAKMKSDCDRFQRENARDLESGSDSRGGHDFWLTRNGHGAGFWDGDWPEPQATRLTDAAKSFGSFDLYVSRRKVVGYPLGPTRKRKVSNPSRLVAKPKTGALAYSVKVDGKTISGGRYRSLASAKEVFRDLQRRYPGRAEMFRGTESYSDWDVHDARRMKSTRKKHHSKAR